jgi:hypothetical protein
MLADLPKKHVQPAGQQQLLLLHLREEAQSMQEMQQWLRAKLLVLQPITRLRCL